MSEQGSSKVRIPWVSVAESMPEIGKRVLVCIGGAFVLIGSRFERNRWVDQRGEFYARSVTHWAELPEPPQALSGAPSVHETKSNCPTCDGIGEVGIPGGTCPICHGKGKLP